MIADLRHVHELTVQALLGARDHAHIACVSDNIAPPQPGARFVYCGRAVVVSETDNVVVLEADKTIAGSCASLLDAFRAMVRPTKK